MGWFNKKKKQQQKQQSDQTAMLQKIATITRLAKSGLLFIDVKEKKVVISATLATVFLSTRERWTNFLTNVHLWFIYKVSQMSWNKYFLDKEVEAVRIAREKYPNLTRLQEADIRAKARAEVQIDMLPPPKIEAYDFILSSDISDGSEPEIFAVGKFEDGSFEMVTFDDVNQKVNPGV